MFLGKLGIELLECCDRRKILWAESGLLSFFGASRWWRSWAATVTPQGLMFAIWVVKSDRYFVFATDLHKKPALQFVALFEFNLWDERLLILEAFKDHHVLIMNSFVRFDALFMVQTLQRLLTARCMQIYFVVPTSSFVLLVSFDLRFKIELNARIMCFCQLIIVYIMDALD